ncbi:MAG: acyltransferase [Candidatus Binatia bacterium]
MARRSSPTPDRFYSLDALRGLAALSVIFWHWQHFFFHGTTAALPDISRLPMSTWAFPLYSHGWLAVDFFFILSGFVFYLLYAQRVAEGRIGPGTFAWLRFSRLYPLHIATLLIVAVGQRWLLSAHGSYFVYPNNDARHFLLNLLFASSWGIERGYSFNGPIWSVSVEVLLYALFFAVCRLLPVRAFVLAAISITGFALVTRYYDPVGRGVGCFFLGGLVFFAYQRVAASAYASGVTAWAACLTAAAWLITFVVASGTPIPPFGGVPWCARLDPYVHWALPAVFSHWPTTILFPATVFSLASMETRRGSLGRRVSFLGDISYAIYLLHFPLQLCCAAFVWRFAIPQTIYYSPWFMALFFTVLIVCALGSYRYFEAPAQRFLRRADIARRFDGGTDARR